MLCATLRCGRISVCMDVVQVGELLQLLVYTSFSRYFNILEMQSFNNPAVIWFLVGFVFFLLEFAVPGLILSSLESAQVIAYSPVPKLFYKRPLLIFSVVRVTICVQ